MAILTTRRDVAIHTREAFFFPSAAVVSGPAAEGSQTPSNASFEMAAIGVMEKLHLAFADLLGGVSAATGTCAEVEKAFGIDAKLAWQVLRIATVSNPLAAGTNVPARVSIQRLLKAAARRGVVQEITERVLAAYNEFERLMEDHAGDRTTLETMLSAHLPEIRAKQELAAKETIFRGVSQLRGVVQDAELAAYFWHPSQTPGHIDMAILGGVFGLRRVHPNAYVNVWMMCDSPSSEHRLLTLERKVAISSTDSLLTDFCTPLPTPALMETFERMGSKEQATTYTPGKDVGLQSAIDVVQGSFTPTGSAEYQADGRPQTAISSFVDIPTKRLTMDMFVHKDVYVDSTPEISVYDMVPIAKELPGIMRSPERERARVGVQERITSITGGLPHARLPHIPRYAEMLKRVCDKLGWNPGDFRGYRLDVQYPVYGAEYWIMFMRQDAARAAGGLTSSGEPPRPLR